LGGREGIKKCVKREKRGSFYRIGRGQPPRGVAGQGEPLLLFMVLFIVVTPSSWW
jgi:hypothetical protein